MLDRFYCSEFPATGPAILDSTEAHHLSRVLRKTVGDAIELFDGRGRVANGEVLRISKKSVEIAVEDIHETPPPNTKIVLASAVPKGDRFRWLVEKAVEWNVECLIPLITQRSVVNPGENKREKMSQVVIETCKQCRRNRLMRIAEPIAWQSFLDSERTNADDTLCLLAHPGRSDVGNMLQTTSASRIVLMVGPEGGFTDEEVEQAVAAKAMPVGLGPNILRIETAAIALATLAAIHRQSES